MHRDFAEWYSAGGRIANPRHPDASRRVGTSLRYGGSAKMRSFLSLLRSSPGRVGGPGARSCQARSTARRRRFREHVDAPTAFVEPDLTVHESEQRPIASGAHVLAGEELGAALADQDAAGGHELAAESFHPKPLADAVAAIADTALTFLMCHKMLRSDW